MLTNSGAAESGAYYRARTVPWLMWSRPWLVSCGYPSEGTSQLECNQPQPGAGPLPRECPHVASASGPGVCTPIFPWPDGGQVCVVQERQMLRHIKLYGSSSDESYHIMCVGVLLVHSFPEIPLDGVFFSFKWDFNIFFLYYVIISWKKMTSIF